jgi:hypothetical protein
LVDAVRASNILLFVVYCIRLAPKQVYGSIPSVSWDEKVKQPLCLWKEDTSRVPVIKSNGNHEMGRKFSMK